MNIIVTIETEIFSQRTSLKQLYQKQAKRLSQREPDSKESRQAQGKEVQLEQKTGQMKWKRHQNIYEKPINLK